MQYRAWDESADCSPLFLIFLLIFSLTFSAPFTLRAWLHSHYLNAPEGPKFIIPRASCCPLQGYAFLQRYYNILHTNYSDVIDQCVSTPVGIFTGRKSSGLCRSVAILWVHYPHWSKKKKQFASTRNDLGGCKIADNNPHPNITRNFHHLFLFVVS
jgi:hypothetical protein